MATPTITPAVTTALAAREDAVQSEIQSAANAAQSAQGTSNIAAIQQDQQTVTAGVGVIVGIVIGIIALCALVMVGVCLFCRRRERRRRAAHMNDPAYQTSAYNNVPIAPMLTDSTNYNGSFPLQEAGGAPHAFNKHESLELPAGPVAARSVSSFDSGHSEIGLIKENIHNEHNHV